MLQFMCSLDLLCGVLLFGCCFTCISAQEDCYTSGSVAGIVIATVVVTLVSTALAGAFIWYLWKQRRAGADKCKDMTIACPPMSPDKQLIVHENDYAFDNPYFKDDETDHIKQKDVEKGESGFRLDNGDITPSQNNAKTANGTNGHAKKSRPFSSLPFHAVFHPSGKKQRATVDDIYISKHLERIVVPLRGHDFTGLGFNICGNMRDGIFVKDLLHRGPASESGKIKAGDRIVAMTVSFGGMVFEDALTMLSYASPYDVKLEIEKANKVTNVTSSPKKLGTSTSFRHCSQKTLLHPLYRSQSIDDLTQIGKDSFLSGNSPAVRAKKEKESSTPKRSQSVEASNGGPKVKPSVFNLKTSSEDVKTVVNSKGSRKSSTSSSDETPAKTTVTVPTPEKAQPVAPAKEEPVKEDKKEIKSSRFRVEQINIKSEAPILPVRQAPPVKPAREASVEEKTAQPTGDSSEKEQLPTDDLNCPEVTSQQNGAQAAETENLQPTPPPRKTNGGPKRRAPAPPPVGSPTTTKTETSADVHRSDEQKSEALVEKSKGEPTTKPPPPPTSDVPGTTIYLETSTVMDPPDLGSSDSSSLASGGQLPESSKDEPTSPGKRKASSLGDLTTLDKGQKKKASTSSAILERAVSMDLQQQSLPGENLIKQKKILKTPTFDNDYDENNEADLYETEDRLKKWEDGLGMVLSGLTNGHTKLDIFQGEDSMPIPMTSKKEHSIEVKVEEPIAPKEVLTADLDTSITELTHEDPLTSTPNHKVVEMKDFIKDDISLDDVPYLASAKQDEEASPKHSGAKASLFSPVTISIPIIKPDLTNFEKLPSPPPANTHPSLDPSWRSNKVSTSEDTARYPLERITVQSLYKPIFSSKDANDNDEVMAADSSIEKLVNGNDSDVSEHYSTAQENTTVSSVDTSTMSVTVSPNNNNVTVKTPNNAAGFAKTLIIPGPNEVESLLSLAAEPNTPPPQIELPPKPVENE